MSFRILLLFEHATLNGGEQSMLAVVDELRQTGDFEFFVAAPAEGRLIDAVRQRALPHLVLAAGTREWRQGMLTRHVECVRPEIVHANSLSMSRMLGSVANAVDSIATGHLRDILRLSAQAIRNLNSLNTLVAVSEATRRHHLAQGLNPNIVQTIYNGVDLQRFQPRAPTGFLHRELGIPAASPIALSIGQIGLRKGLDTLAAAAVQLRDLKPDLHWVMCGERYSGKAESIACEQSVQESFQCAGMSERFHRLGYRSDIPAIMNEVRVLVHAARQEPLGRVLLEAAASGLPVVATDVGGTSEILIPGQSGWLVPVNHPSAVADAVRLVLDSPTLARERAAVARREVERRFSIALAARRMADFWRESLDR